MLARSQKRVRKHVFKQETSLIRKQATKGGNANQDVTVDPALLAAHNSTISSLSLPWTIPLL